MMTDLEHKKILHDELKFHLQRLCSTHSRLLSEIRFRDNVEPDIFHDQFQLNYHREVMFCLRNMQYDLLYLYNVIEELTPIV